MLSLLSLGLPAGGKEQALAPRQLAYHEGSCPVGCEEVTSGPTIHGDPMFKVNGMGTRFMLPDGEPTELLRWKTPDGESMALSGTTFGTDSTSGHQWFKQFFITQENGGQRLRVLLDVSAEQTETGSMRALVNNKDFLDMGTLEKPAKRHQINKHLSVLPHIRAAERLAIGNVSAQQLKIDAGGLSMRVFSSKAAKFQGKKAQVKYMHLNVRRARAKDGDTPAHCRPTSKRTDRSRGRAMAHASGRFPSTRADRLRERLA